MPGRRVRPDGYVSVEAIMDERPPNEVTLPGLMKGFPVEWDRQRKIGRPTVVEV